MIMSIKYGGYEMISFKGKVVLNCMKLHLLAIIFLFSEIFFVPQMAFGQQGPGKLIALLVNHYATSQYGNFQKGETISIPKALLSVIDSKQSQDSIVYLTMVNASDVQTPFYIISSRRLNMIDLQYQNTIFEDLTLVYIGKNTYSSSGVQRETFVFGIQDSQTNQPPQALQTKPVQDKSIVEALLNGAESGNTIMVKTALDSGIDPNVTREKGTPKYNNEIKRGTNLIGLTALMYAAINNHIEIVKLLINAGASIEQKASDGSTALYLATQFGYPQIVKLLLDSGANPNIVNKNGTSALAAAVSAGNTDLVQLLITVKSDLGWRDKEGKNLLMFIRDGDTNTAKLLIDNGVDVNCTDNDGMTVLMYASMKKKNEEVVKLLLKSGANPNTIKGGGYTALMQAITNYNYETVKALIAAGTDLSIVNSRGETALIEAVQYGQSESVKLLLAAKADINFRNSEDLTPLMIAIDNDHNKTGILTKILLEAGADVNATTSQQGGSTALIRAKLKGNDVVIKLLESYNAK
jgi:ankyrin repeat protein